MRNPFWSGPIKRTLSIVLFGVVVIVVMTLFILRFGVLTHIDDTENRVLSTGPNSVSQGARAVHEAAFVADLHADSLLWKRDLLKRNTRGHVDIPRLRDGGVDLQVFSVVTKVSKTRNYDANPGDKDSLPPSRTYLNWRLSQWSSRTEECRALVRVDGTSQMHS